MRKQFGQPVFFISPVGQTGDNNRVALVRALEILAEVENKYNITIDPDNLMKMTCIDEVVKLTESYLKPHE